MEYCPTLLSRAHAYKYGTGDEGQVVWRWSELRDRLGDVCFWRHAIRREKHGTPVAKYMLSAEGSPKVLIGRRRIAQNDSPGTEGYGSARHRRRHFIAPHVQHPRTQGLFRWDRVVVASRFDNSTSATQKDQPSLVEDRPLPSIKQGKDVLRATLWIPTEAPKRDHQSWDTPPLPMNFCTASPTPWDLSSNLKTQFTGVGLQEGAPRASGNSGGHGNIWIETEPIVEVSFGVLGEAGLKGVTRCVCRCVRGEKADLLILATGGQVCLILGGDRHPICCTHWDIIGIDPSSDWDWSSDRVGEKTPALGGRDCDSLRHSWSLVLDRGTS